MAHPAEGEIRELIERGIELVRSYAIFMELSDARIKDTSGFRDHVDFFEATANAHLQSFFIIICLLYDKRRGVKSIPNLTGRFLERHPKTVKRLRQQIADNASLLNKLRDVRGSVFAHRNGSESPKEVLSRNKLPKGYLKKVINLTTRHLSTLGALTGIDTQRELRSEFSRREQYARDDARLVLNAASK